MRAIDFSTWALLSALATLGAVTLLGDPKWPRHVKALFYGAVFLALFVGGGFYYIAYGEQPTETAYRVLFCPFRPDSIKCRERDVTAAPGGVASKAEDRDTPPRSAPPDEGAQEIGSSEVPKPGAEEQGPAPEQSEAKSHPPGRDGTAWWEQMPGIGIRERDEGSSGTVIAEEAEEPRPGADAWTSEAVRARLEQAVKTYGAIVEAGGWRTIPGTRMIRPGNDDERVPMIRRHLAMTGDLDGKTKADGYALDEGLVAAVKRFQRRHGLRTTGRVDQPTIAAMNIPAEARLTQLNLNLKRLQESRRFGPGEAHVSINIPSFELEAAIGGRSERRHKVIVGRPERATKLRGTSIVRFDVLPSWRVPQSFAESEILPKLRAAKRGTAARDALKGLRMRVYSGSYDGEEIDAGAVDWSKADTAKYRFMQEPGRDGALGVARLYLQDGISYMSGTNTAALFRQRSRPFSSDGVRIEEEEELLKWLVNAGGAGGSEVESLIKNQRSQTVALKTPVAIDFVYITAWADADGKVQFRADIYGQETAILARSEEPAALPPPPQALAP